MPVAVPDERDPPRRDLGSSSSTRIRSSLRSVASSGASATPKPAPTRPWTVPLSSERKATSTATPRCESSPSASVVLRQSAVADQRQVPDLGETRASGRRARARPGRQDVGVGEQLDGLEGPVQERRHRESEIELSALDEPDELLVGRRLGQLDLDLRPRDSENGASRPAAPVRRRSGTSDPKPAAVTLRERGHVALRGVEPGDDRLGVAEQEPAGLRQRDRARAARPLEQALADEPLEGLDLLADRRLRVAERGRGAPERSFACNRFEGGEMTARPRAKYQVP